VTTSDRFRQARDQLLALRTDATAACREFAWPAFERFNWARDHFDVVARDPSRLALRVVDESGIDVSLTYAELAARSARVAAFLSSQGVGPGDRILLMLGNVVPLWETMLAAIRLGAVMIPATTLLQRDDLADRLERGAVKAIVAQGTLADRFEGLAPVPIRIAVGERVSGWAAYDDADRVRTILPVADTSAEDLLLLYFTSGTTSRPKLVAHTHVSYPVGHLSTMYWLGLQPGDVHLNLSSPGWAKHAWSCVFAPWNAEATVLAYQYDRFHATSLLDKLVACGVTSFCAPPTVWRLLIQEDLRHWPIRLREITSAGEPLNPEVIDRVRDAWGLTIRDGFGQTETTAQIGNPPSQPVKAGSMGRPLPGYSVALLGPDGTPADEGEICLDLSRRPLGLMQGYLDDAGRTAEALRGGYYFTGDMARRDEDGYITYLARGDDLFKSSDYRISPFELESVLLEHAAVAEAAVVPSPDPIRLSVPKAYVVVAAGHAPDAATACSILAYVRSRVSPYKRVRRLEFGELPKTVSGKIRRVELRQHAAGRAAAVVRDGREFREEDFSEPIAGSLGTERGERVRLRGAAGREERRTEHDRDEDERDEGEDRGIERTDVEEPAEDP
jgi:acetyl-CoA synthetase